LFPIVKSTANKLLAFHLTQPQIHVYKSCKTVFAKTNGKVFKTHYAFYKIKIILI